MGMQSALSCRAHTSFELNITMRGRLGQTDLHVHNRIVGSMWVREIKADTAFQPRILLAAGCQFMNVPPQSGSQSDAKAYRFATLGGQLRWGAEDGPVIGDLSFPRMLAHCKSTDYHSEQWFEVSCDVPYHVLSRLDERRAGGPMVTWMDLHGSWAIGGTVEPIMLLRPWQVEVPAEMWVKFLNESGYFDFNLIMIHHVIRDGGHSGPTVAYLAEARELLSSDPRAAVAKCRLVLEAAEEALDMQNQPKQWTSKLETYTAPARAPGYDKIIRGIKKVISTTHHKSGEEKDVSIAEGKAIVLMCEALVEMLSAPRDR